MDKLMDRLRGLLPRRRGKPVTQAKAETEASDPGPVPIPGEEPVPADPVPADPAPPASGEATPESAPVDESVPVASEGPEEAAPRAEPVPPVPTREADLSFALAGLPGRPGVSLEILHAGTGQAARDKFPEALYPGEVEVGEYVLDVTGHALAFGPPGRPGANVLVPVRTRSDTASAMPRNASGNALVPLDVRVIERMDRETGLAKTRLRRPPIVALAFRVLAAEADVFEVESGPGPDLDAEDAVPLRTGAEERARGELDMMGYLLAQQTFEPPGTVAPTVAAEDDDEGEKERDADGAGSGDLPPSGSEPSGTGPSGRADPAPEWIPSTAYGR